MTKSLPTILPRRQGEIALYESETAHVRFHIEKTSQAGLYGVENIREGISLCPRTREQIERLVAKHRLVFIEMT